MEEVVPLGLQADENADPQRLKEEYMLEKMAAIFAGCIALGRQVRELETKFNKSSEET